MINDLDTAMVFARRDAVAREAASSRLARLATCCEPSYLRARLAAGLHWLRNGQLGAGYVDRPAAPLTSRCCV
jgi:hypothetical protein